jgi:hypothetical protein
MLRFYGEPPLSEVLSDPTIQVLMRADGTDTTRTCDILLKARRASATPRIAAREDEPSLLWRHRF